MNTNMFPNFGDLHDNASAFQIALYEIKHGDKAWGYEVLVKLRDHIERTMEIESIQWLLPEVLTAIKELDSPGLIPNTSESLVRV